MEKFDNLKTFEFRTSLGTSGLLKILLINQQW